MRHTALEFIDQLKDATLDSDCPPDDARVWMAHPYEFQPELSKDHRLCLDIFLASTPGSNDSYVDSINAIHHHTPSTDVLSLHEMKNKIVAISGVVPVMTDMCEDSCVAFTGPFAEREVCPECKKSRWCVKPTGRTGQMERHPAKQYLTLPLGPQLQVLYHSPEGAVNMQHRHNYTVQIREGLARGEGIKVYDDVYAGRDYLAVVDRGDLSEHDIVVMASWDGAQLYRYKQSDCWFYIWVNMNLSPELRYKKKYPKNLDSFMFPGLHHLVALQKEGLRMWDARINEVYTSFIYFYLGLADGPGLAFMNGQVPHHGAYGCHLYCGLKGRHKQGASHYFPALAKPPGYSIVGCDHESYDVYQLPTRSDANYVENLKKVLASETNAEFKEQRKATGICKPSIFSALPRNCFLGVLGCFAIDIMHILTLNITSLLIVLWRGTIDCDPKDLRETSVWKAHGAAVAAARCYLPETINSGYKAWEFCLWIFGLAPSLLYGILPLPYWKHFCKLVYAIRILQQRSIQATQIPLAHQAILEFTKEFEELYCQGKSERIHFVRQCVHGLSHLAPEWTLENTIGNLGREIKQDHHYYANLEQRAVRHASVNALKVGMPDIEPDRPYNQTRRLPCGAYDIQDGFVLLTAKDRYAHTFRNKAAAAIRTYMEKSNIELEEGWQPRYKRWACLRLPNGQTATALWKEGQRRQDQIRRSRNVKIISNGATFIAEVQAYFNAQMEDNITQSLALVSVFGEPDQEMLRSSSNTVWVASYKAETNLAVVDVKDIQSVVAMIPWQHENPVNVTLYFLDEKPGLDMMLLVDEDEEEQEDEDEQAGMA
ncbi:hypothetical protein OF83DRAFT_1164840 [Amylostereum chailletii]|nr:hypothetical protein OF83DRAFT_1164840 [Amylostereum chailletii]